MPSLVDVMRPPKIHWHVEDGLVAAALLGATVLPMVESVMRATLGTGIPGSAGLVQNLTLWIGFLGAMIATREHCHLSIATGGMLDKTRFGDLAAGVRTGASVAVTLGLAWAALRFVVAEMDSALSIGGWLPLWTIELIMPAGLAVMTYRFAIDCPTRNAAIAALAIAASAVGLSMMPPEYVSVVAWPAVIALGGAAILGTPLFIVLGGLTLILFIGGGLPTAAIAVEGYRLVTSPVISILALFTFAGYLLAEGGASRRLVRLFRALFGWLPGGLAIVATLVCAFFTTFTGATGVTILALGGLLRPILVRNGYSERFSIGLLAATGSIGLLFPPSLPAIMFGVVANISILDVFVAGFVPGLLLVAAVAALGVHAGLRTTTPRPPFDVGELLAAARDAKWELGLPLIVLGGLFGGFSTLVETAATTAVYALLVETVIHRDLGVRADVLPLVVRSSALVGGVFMILAVSMGLTNYLVDAEIPARLAGWAHTHIGSRAMFLLALNLFLLAVGCTMDIFSAIVVIVPLLLPTARAFGVDPLHLGIVFLLNLELGYLTPPVGLNLFLAAFRFNQTPMAVFRSAVPFILVMAAVVLTVTYVPDLALAYVRK